MAFNFFELDTNETKQILRDETIVKDTIKITNGDSFFVTLNNNAPKLKIKMWLDVIQYVDPNTQVAKNYKHGEYMELEEKGIFSVMDTDRNELISLKYICDKVGNTYQISFISNNNYYFYFSSVSLQDSFYNSLKNWYDENQSFTYEPHRIDHGGSGSSGGYTLLPGQAILTPNKLVAKPIYHMFTSFSTTVQFLKLGIELVTNVDTIIFNGTTIQVSTPDMMVGGTVPVYYATPFNDGTRMVQVFVNSNTNVLTVKGYGFPVGEDSATVLLKVSFQFTTKT